MVKNKALQMGLVVISILLILISEIIPTITLTIIILNISVMAYMLKTLIVSHLHQNKVKFSVKQTSSIYLQEE
jgi:hypothetical protein